MYFSRRLLCRGSIVVPRIRAVYLSRRLLCRGSIVVPRIRAVYLSRRLLCRGGIVVPLIICNKDCLTAWRTAPPNTAAYLQAHIMENSCPSQYCRPLTSPHHGGQLPLPILPPIYKPTSWRTVAPPNTAAYLQAHIMEDSCPSQYCRLFTSPHHGGQLPLPILPPIYRSTAWRTVAPPNTAAYLQAHIMENSCPSQYCRPLTSPQHGGQPLPILPPIDKPTAWRTAPPNTAAYLQAHIMEDSCPSQYCRLFTSPHHGGQLPLPILPPIDKPTSWRTVAPPNTAAH